MLDRFYIFKSNKEMGPQLPRSSGINRRISSRTTKLEF